jgi:hypothetical protein
MLSGFYRCRSRRAWANDHGSTMDLADVLRWISDHLTSRLDDLIDEA